MKAAYCMLGLVKFCSCGHAVIMCGCRFCSCACAQLSSKLQGVAAFWQNTLLSLSLSCCHATVRKHTCPNQQQCAQTDHVCTAMHRQPQLAKNTFFQLHALQCTVPATTCTAASKAQHLGPRHNFAIT